MPADIETALRLRLEALAAGEVPTREKPSAHDHGLLVTALSEIEKLRSAGSVNERISFRLIRMECCGQLICWINPRLPTHCPECGSVIYPKVKEWILVNDQNAHIKYKFTGSIDKVDPDRSM